MRGTIDFDDTLNIWKTTGSRMAMNGETDYSNLK
nr:MAG TPA: hypothetical protein [Caudoviricetes sp.]